MRILLTGFEPFGGEKRNPSGELATEVAGANSLDAEIVGAVLPVAFRRAGRRMRELIEANEPTVVLALGLATGATALRLERVGVNYFRGGPDNQGETYADEPIIPNAPAAYFATVTVTELVKTLNENGIPARDSMSAGTYCCNEVLFTALHVAAEEGAPIRVGFVHLPLFPEQVGTRSLASVSRDVQRRGIETILKAVTSMEKA